MKVAFQPHCSVSFCTNQNETNSNKNPISKTGERATLLKATVVAGLAFGGKCLLELFDGDFLFDDFINAGEKIAQKNKASGLKQLGIWGGIIGGFVLAMAALYTLVKTPKIMYDGNVNAFKKGKDMDVYIKGNQVEKDLYNQMSDKAKEATPEEKEVLKQQYLKLRAAKNQTPDFIQQQK